MPADQSHSSDAARFHALARQWHEETGFLSSPTAITEHPAYQEIIRMGAPVVPLILRDMESQTDHWFHALEIITGDNPIPKEHVGHMEKMRDDWLAWGHSRGLI